MNLLLMNHNTISKEHIKLCLKSLRGSIFDVIYIHNNSTDINTNFIIEELVRTKILYCDIKVLSIPHIKTLNGDLKSISEQIPKDDKMILILKCDYSISYKTISELNKMYIGNYLYTLPTVNAKETVDDHEIEEYLNRDAFVTHDTITYYRGSDYFEPRHELGLYDTELCDDVKYISWGGSLDFNVHYINQKLLTYFGNEDVNVTWGGCYSFHKMKNDGITIVKNDNCFAVHKYHGIISKNNNTDRNDSRKVQYGHRY